MTATAPIYASRAQARRGRIFDPTPAKVQEILRSRERQLAVVGPAGTGKTKCDLEKIRLCCLKYPGCRWLITRSYRQWLTQSALVTWEEKVIEPGMLVPDKIRRESRSEYRFRNGSIVAIAGLDDPDKVMSTEWDGVLVVEATEVNQETAEQLGTRLRNGVMPYQQLILECNPASPRHWIKTEIDAGRLPCIENRHTDNPHYFNPKACQWTPAGVEYMARLDLLTGTRRLRLRDGKWAQAEGVVYERWDSTIHVIPSFSIPADWTRYIVIDFGFTNPMVVQWWAVDGDGRAFLYREIYMTGRLVEDVAGWVKRLHAKYGEPVPRTVICDHDREDRATFEKHTGWSTEAADKVVEIGIQDVAARLTVQGDGKPRLFVFADALCHEPDEKLKDLHKPTSTAKEFDGYVWDPKAKKGEVPLKQDDHGMDATRYLCRYLASGNMTSGGTVEYGTPENYSISDLPADTFG